MQNDPRNVFDLTPSDLKPSRQQKEEFLESQWTKLRKAKTKPARKPVSALGRRPRLRLVTKGWAARTGWPLHREFKPKRLSAKAQRIEARRQRSLAAMREARRARIAAEVRVPV